MRGNPMALQSLQVVFYIVPVKMSHTYKRHLAEIMVCSQVHIEHAADFGYAACA